MTGPAPAVARTRRAVRTALADLDDGAPVGVALSGGADSLALLAATTSGRRRVSALVVDQGWHPGSRQVAERAAAAAWALGADARVLDGRTDRQEAAARTARYAALDAAADDLGLAAVLLGHTRDDQAETVLLGLARGSGARSLAGMAAVRGRYRRPLLDLPRADTAAACAALGLHPQTDPANADPAFARVRVRALLPDLAVALGHDVAANLATTARLLRDDADLLDALAADAGRSAAADTARAGEPGDGYDATVLAALPAALRRRVLHRLAPGLTAVHVEALDALVRDWRGQGPVGLPGGATAVRRSGRIAVVPAAGQSATRP